MSKLEITVNYDCKIQIDTILYFLNPILISHTEDTENKQSVIIVEA